MWSSVLLILAVFLVAQTAQFFFNLKVSLFLNIIYSALMLATATESQLSPWLPHALFPIFRLRRGHPDELLPSRPQLDLDLAPFRWVLLQSS